jgi:hypothetical protein
LLRRNQPTDDGGLVIVDMDGISPDREASQAE